LSAISEVREQTACGRYRHNSIFDKMEYASIFPRKLDCFSIYKDCGAFVK
jgi:hypothetical protein